MHEISGHLFRMLSQILKPRFHSILVQFCDTANRAHTIFLDEKITQLAHFLHRQSLPIQRSSAPLHKIFMTIIAIISLSSSTIKTTLNDILPLLFPKKTARLVLTNNFDLSLRPSHEITSISQRKR